MKYFYYQRTMLGRWSPRGSDTRPEPRSADGARHTITQVTDVPAMFQHMSLFDLANFYPLKEL